MRFWVLFVIICSACIVNTPIQAQVPQMPIGAWQSYYPYNVADAVAAGDGKIYAGSIGMLQYDALKNEYTSYSKVNGMNDAGISKMGYEPSTQSLVIIYQSSNIDIFQNGDFFNLPDIKEANIIASKKISNVKFYNGDAYCATGLGIVVLNLIKHEVRTTYPMVIGGIQASVQDVLFKNDSIYAFTNRGVYTADARSKQLEDILNWTKVGNNSFNHSAALNDKIFVCNDNDLFEFTPNGSPNYLYSSPRFVTDLEVLGSKLYVGDFENFGMIKIFDNQGVLQDSIVGLAPKQLAVYEDKILEADFFQGVISIDENKNARLYSIPGPAVAYVHNLKVIDGKLHILHGGVDIGHNALFSRSGLSVYDNGNWKIINQFAGYPMMDTISDILTILKDPNSGKFILPSYGTGLMELNADYTFHKLTKSEPLSVNSSIPNNYLCSDAELDNFNNLWVIMSNADNNILLKNRTGTWFKYNIPLSNDYKVLGDAVVDNANQLWVILPRANGLAVYNTNNTFENTSDDQYRFYRAGAIAGNLASTGVLSIAKDKDGKLWVGTDDGISIINCPESALTSSGCQAENKIVQYDALAADKLFKEENVTTIAVDEANRKWVGTGNGAWLISADAEKVLARFTTANSPLPSNSISKIEIDKATGLVYIGTDRGLVAYRGGAVEGANESAEPFTFPNPVPSGYTGTIAIKNLIDEADVRITDAAGNLVYRGKALGGQLIWDGLTYTGQRPQSGVYYIFATSKDGNKRQDGKFALFE
jgi:hypothetical protein